MKDIFSRNTFLWSAVFTIILLAVIGFGVSFIFFKNGTGNVACTLEAKLCPDGSIVGRSGPQCEFAPCPSGDTFTHDGNIVRDNPGLKPGVWYLVYERPGAPALSVELSFDTQSTCSFGGATATCAPDALQQGTRVHLDGITNGDTVLVRTLAATSTNANVQGREVKLYYYNWTLDKDAQGNTLCSRQGLVSVTRVIPRTNTPIQDTIKLLLRGEISPDESAQGITSEFPLPGVTLAGANLGNGILTLAFNDPQFRTSGGACRAGVLWFQIEATAKQFPGVASVRFTPEDLFQP